MSQVEDRLAAEGERLLALHALRILDTPAEERFDRITRIAAELFGAPIALINLVDADRQWAKSCVGLAELDIPRENSFCAHEMDRTDALVIPDATRDARFAGNPLVVGPPYIRFYGGAMVRSADGLPLGRLCVVDSVPRDPADQPIAALTDLATWVELELHGGSAPAPPEDPAALALMQERFMTVAAHELRTPLTLIRGYSDELLESAAGALTGDQRHAAAAIGRGAARLEHLIGELLLLLTLDAGRLRLQLERVAVARLVQGVRTELDRVAADASVNVAVDVPVSMAVTGDGTRLAVALSALLRNAITWSPPGGTVRITASVEARELRLTVSDSGPGLPPGERAAVGRRFRRLRGLDPREGPGLGLAIARAIADLHGGRLEADAEAEGAALSLVLPTARGDPVRS